MSTGAAGGGLFRNISDGCISGSDTGIQRRPYHRNCSCELHKSDGKCSHSSRGSKISYPIRRNWSEGSLASMSTSSFHSSSEPMSRQTSPKSCIFSTAPIARKEGMVRVRTYLELLDEE